MPTELPSKHNAMVCMTYLLMQSTVVFTSSLPTAAAASATSLGVPGPIRAAAPAPRYTCAANTYVSANAGSDSNPGTQAQPWKTLARANNAYPAAGTCINVEPGTYNLTQSVTITHGGNVNTPSGFVVYRSTVPRGAHLIPATSAVGDIFQLEVPYIIIDGFDVDGNHALTTGNGVNGCVGGGGPSFISHHFVAVNNWFHDLGGAGLASCTADYIIWKHNAVYNTSSTSPYAVSGIDVGAPQQLRAGSYTRSPADNVAFGIVVAYNDVHDNGEGASIGGAHTDGNGIIVDTTNANASGYPGYGGNILLLGNLSYHNGGGGIHIYNSHNVTVADNTVYQNYQDLRNPGSPRGELSNGGSQNVNWFNNIAIAVPGPGVLAGAEPVVSFPVGSSQDSGTWDKNITYGAPNTSDTRSYLDPAANLINVNPLLNNPAAAQFHPVTGSPAIKSGVPKSFIPSPTPDIGAF